MHAIFIRGRNEPIVVDDIIGRELKDRWAEDRFDADEKLELDGVSFHLKSIYRIENRWIPERDRAADRSRNNDFYQHERQQFEEHIRSLRRQPIEQRARSLTIPKFIWYAGTGAREIPSDTAERIIERQEYYFRDNPGDAYASPIWYRDLIPNADAPYRSVLPPIRNRMREHSVLFAEQVLQAAYTVR